MEIHSRREDQYKTQEGDYRLVLSDEEQKEVAGSKSVNFRAYIPENDHFFARILNAISKLFRLRRELSEVDLHLITNLGSLRGKKILVSSADYTFFQQQATKYVGNAILGGGKGGQKDLLKEFKPESYENLSNFAAACVKKHGSQSNKITDTFSAIVSKLSIDQVKTLIASVGLKQQETYAELTFGELYNGINTREQLLVVMFLLNALIKESTGGKFLTCQSDFENFDQTVYESLKSDNIKPSPDCIKDGINHILKNDVLRAFSEKSFGISEILHESISQSINAIVKVSEDVQEIQIRRESEETLGRTSQFLDEIYRYGKDLKPAHRRYHTSDEFVKSYLLKDRGESYRINSILYGFGEIEQSDVINLALILILPDQRHCKLVIPMSKIDTTCIKSISEEIRGQISKAIDTI